MRRMFILIIFISISLMSQQKIGYIDSQRILTEYKGAAEIKRRYEQKVSEWRDKADNIKKDIQNLQEELQTQNLMLSEEAKVRKMQEIENKQREYQEFIQSVWGESGEAAQLNQELMQPLLREVDTLITNIGEEEGFSVILDASSGAIVYAEDALDITDRVIDALNVKYLPEATEKIEYYVVKFKEEDADAKSRNLGERIKNLVDIALKGTGGFENIESQLIINAKDNLGILDEEEITEEKSAEILTITDGNFIVIGRVWIDAGNIFFEYRMVDKKQGIAVITETVDVGVEDNLTTELISKEVISKIDEYYQ